MNVFRLAGECLLFAATLFILHRVVVQRRPDGLSRPSQLLLALVSSTRYVDIGTHFHMPFSIDYPHSLGGKIFMLAARWTTVCFLYLVTPMATTYSTSSSASDSSPSWLLLTIPCALLALTVNYCYYGLGDPYAALELPWTFSIYLEVVALIPQLWLSLKQAQKETVPRAIIVFLLAMGTYRGLYLAYWLWEWGGNPGHDPIKFCSGCVESALVLIGTWMVCRVDKGAVEKNVARAIYVLPSMAKKPEEGRPGTLMPVDVQNMMASSEERYLKLLRGPNGAKPAGDRDALMNEI